jgi:predicted nucleotidyltransferase
LDYRLWDETTHGGLKMDFEAALETLRIYLAEQSFLQKISSLNDLKDIQTPAITLLLTQKGNLFCIPEEMMFKNGFSFLDDDWVDFESMAKERIIVRELIEAKEPIMIKDRYSKPHIIKSSIDLYNNLVEYKIIKSGYWDLFNKSREIKFEDNIIILKKTLDSSEFDEILLIKGPMNHKITKLPGFLDSIEKITEFTYQTTPYTNPPRMDHFLSYRELHKANKLTWDMNQIRSYLGSIWNERTPHTVISRINVLFESVVLLTEKNTAFNKFLQVDKDQKTMVGIPSNFIIGVCGGYARGEYSDTSDLDMLLIHEGNDQQFLKVGEALDQVLQYVPNLELCKLENLVNLNFHEDSIPTILQALLNGDDHFLKPNQRLQLNEMFSSIETLRKTPLSPEERSNGISKYCWSIYKSLVNMVPIYEKPIGKGQFLRDEITRSTRNAIYKIIPILIRITESLKDENNTLGENLRVCQPFLYDSIFKTHSVITALQDLSTILAVLNGINFTSTTIDRFKIAIEQKIISEVQGRKLIQGYTSFSEIKYKLTEETPIKAVELINEELKSIIKEVYSHILQNSEPEELVEAISPIAYPLLVFSDLHWGLNNKIAEHSLAEIKNACKKHHVRSILIAGDVFNIDRVNELSETDKEGVSLLNELSQIQNSLGDQRIHIISGNHDPYNFYNQFRVKLERELDIHFLGDFYKDENIWVEHGDKDFWKNFAPPLDHYISRFRAKNDLIAQKIIVGHNHSIHEEVETKFYANGSLGKTFSAILVQEDSIELLRLPISYSIDFDKINAEYVGIINAEDSINDYIQENFRLIDWKQYCSNIQLNATEKETWIITQDGSPSGFIPFNMVVKTSKLENIQVYEVAFPINYTFKVDQTLKEAWGIFSITGESILPVMDEKNQIVGTLSIFSVPKPEKKHAKTKAVEIDPKMEKIGDFLTEKLFEKQKKID